MSGMRARSNIARRKGEMEFSTGALPPARAGSYARKAAVAISGSGVSMESGFAVTPWIRFTMSAMKAGERRPTLTSI